MASTTTSSYYLKAAAHKELESLAKPGSVKEIPSLLQDDSRNSQLYIEFDNIIWDGSRERIDGSVLNHLLSLADQCQLTNKIQDMFNGKKINLTENRSVLHTALRADKNTSLVVDGQNVTEDVHHVLSNIKKFSEAIRSGQKKGHSGKTLTDTICIGIGGSYLGSEFVFEALRTHTESASKAKGRKLHFLANVDPIDIARAVEGFNPETTLVIIVSKTFTTAETILNAKSIKEWILKHFNGDESAVAKHVCAVSTNLPETKKFGIADENVFGFWDWVGGRFSVCSAVGVLPLAIQYGFETVEEFLKGARSIDKHFLEERNMTKNIPVMMGLTQFWNSTYLGYKSLAVLPYCQALCRFPAHIQQLTMESNGKQTRVDGTELPNGGSGEVYFGEPGTNGQHSFYQLIHQGQIVPCEFIGFSKSQQPFKTSDHSVSNHDELMSNFFAQPDALAYGKSTENLQKENVPTNLLTHKTFTGNRPSSSILFLDHLTPYRTGQLLSLYEHRTAVQGFLWGVNSFDQWGVELGKVLAKRVREVFAHKDNKQLLNELPKPTQLLITKYLNNA